MNNNVLKDAAVLIVMRDTEQKRALQSVLEKQCALLETAVSIPEAEQIQKRCYFDLIILNHDADLRAGLDWLQVLRNDSIDTDAVVIVNNVNHDIAVRALNAYVHDLIQIPYTLQNLTRSIYTCIEKRVRARKEFINRTNPIDHVELDIIGQSPVIEILCELIKRVAMSQTTVLVQGETGTGKELVAKAIHEHSGKQGPFVPVNCGSIAPDLLESELFGHTKGAFTGAYASREGLCFFAQGGTLFLDEISEMPISMQAKLLRMLEQRSIRPVGSEREVSVDCRIIAASNRDLKSQVTMGRFREDLFYRLNVFSLDVPSLRERREDIPLLAKYFIERLSKDLGIAPFPLTHQDIVRLQTYSWPGNVRELRNIIERSLLLGKLPADLFADDTLINKNAGTDFVVPTGWTLEDVEKQFILNTLQHVNGNKSEAARRMGVSRKTVERKLNEWNKSVEFSD